MVPLVMGCGVDFPADCFEGLADFCRVGIVTYPFLSGMKTAYLLLSGRTLQRGESSVARYESSSPRSFGGEILLAQQRPGDIAWVISHLEGASAYLFHPRGGAVPVGK